MDRFPHQQNGGHANAHQRRHDGVGHGPAQELGQIQRSGAGDQGAEAITADIHGRHGALVFGTDDFDTIGIQGHVLGGRGEGHQQGGQCKGAGMGHRIGVGHDQQAGGDAHLPHQHPAAPLAQPAGEPGQRHPIHDWRPQDLDGIGDPHPAEETDHRAAEARLGQPARQGAEHQQERQARREPQKQHGQHLRPAIDGPGFMPAVQGGQRHGRIRGCNRDGVLVL